MAEVIIGPLVKVLVENLASNDLWKFARKERIHTLLTEWKSMLEHVQAVVADAEEKQITDREIMLWLSELEDLSYDMDDILDEFATEALRRKVMEDKHRASTSKVRALLPNCCTSFSPPSSMVSDFRKSCKMDAITERLKSLFDQRMKFGLQTRAVGGSDRAPQTQITSSLPADPFFYGRDKDKKKIIELLLRDQSDGNKVGVVPIVGMGGVGKTALAQMVYNDEEVDKHFEMKSWVCVSDQLNIIGVTKTILNSVTPKTCESEDLDLDKVQVKLKKALAGKKFLIVLDDVWNKNYHDWCSLKSPFIDGAPGSKVLVTTRDNNVASTMTGTSNYHSLTKLSDDDCWSVFAQHAFEYRSQDANPNLVSIGQEIIKKCNGLPLAAKTLGGLLRCKFTEGEWKKVLNSKMWELPQEENHILPALRLSYHHLPPHLKKCFAYCSILPKDYEFEEEELVLLWMAEGLIPKQTEQQQMEDLGCEYFQELLSRSLFQPSSSDGLFVMHDLINDLARFLTWKISFRLEDKLKECGGDEGIIKARHSSYTREDRDGIKKFEPLRNAKKLRTFLPCGTGSRDQNSSYLTSDVPLHLLPGLRRLRVLSLRRYQIGELSNSIGKLKHLRYLDLSCALILVLPESIDGLYNLQTLILRYCTNLKELPRNTSNLINLRHLDVTGAYSLQEMPPKIGKLTSLRTLSNFIVGNGNESTMAELGDLIHLRGRLSISGLENVTDAPEARKANLKDKHGLNVLSMKWSNISDNPRNESVDLKVLEMLEPHKNLKELSIYGYGGLTFPTWIGNSLYTNMVSLKFQNCKNCLSLPPLGQLPSLVKLCIEGMKAVKNVGLGFYGLGCSDPFPALEILTFEDMAEWIDWTPFEVKEGAQAFARLSKLSIINCPELSHELPRNLPCLTKLDIQGCPKLVVSWFSSPTKLNEVRNMLHFDSLVSLQLNNVSIPDSFYSSDEADDQAVLESSRDSLLGSLTSLEVKNIEGHACLPNWFFQGLTGLQELRLYGFKELTTLWENEVRLQHRLPGLQCLKIERCPKLVTLFAEGDDLKSLQKLSIQSCPLLVSFPVLPSTLRKFSIGWCDGILSLPDLTLLSNLEKLELSSCKSLTYLSSGRGLPPALKYLRAKRCEELKSVIAEEGIKIDCPSLESIEFFMCESLKTLPDVMQSNGLRNLSRLSICHCENLESLPEGWFPTANLTEFNIDGCEKLEPLPDHAYKDNHLASLERLRLSSSPMGTGLLSHILDEGSSSCFTNLTDLSLSNFDMGKLCGLHRLSSLRSLDLRRCDWVSFPEDGMLSLPSSLIKLEITEFPNLEKLSLKDFQYLVSLEELWIESCPKLTSISELGQLPSLLELSIDNCPNLTSFPEQGQLPSLLYLWIYSCPKLTSFPKQGLPPSLLELYISGCPKLKRGCEKGKGEYWRFIAHIPHVVIH